MELEIHSRGAIVTSGGLLDKGDLGGCYQWFYKLQVAAEFPQTWCCLHSTSRAGDKLWGELGKLWGELGTQGDPGGVRVNRGHRCSRRDHAPLLGLVVR